MPRRRKPRHAQTNRHQAPQGPGYDGSREIGGRAVEDPYDPENIIVVPANLRHDPLLRMFSRREIDDAQLKAGETVTLDDGRIINGATLCGPPRPGCSLVYCTDTVFCDAAVELARGADLLIHESTFAHGEAEMAIAKQHSTSTMAAQTALAAGVKQLMLTHLSPRYMPGNPVTPNDLLAEARSIFPNTELAKDFLTLELSAAEA
jgi:hypothetical protein